MKQFIEAINISIQTDNWYSALALSLTLPDICGKIDYPDLGSQSRYSKWFDMYVGEKYKITLGDNTHIFMTGSDCYALRCSFLHEGSNNVSEQKAREIVTEKFVLMYSQGVQIHKAQYEGKLALYLPTFCTDIANGAIRWLNEIENDHDETRKNKNDGLMKIYLLDSYHGNMVFTQIGDLWKET